ncbi:VapE domain-containing protein [Polaromonas sp.]|uniref:VapE domain-containing protein n=1 Tax=Polaromonas sp. TaxID=1869339 RepID=UPI0035623626
MPGSSPPGAGKRGLVPRIDFKKLAAELLDRAEQLVPNWISGGKIFREGSNGPEYKCAGLDGGAGRSCSVNLKTGQWADFAYEGEQGGDLLSLYAAITHGGDQLAAAKDLVEQFNLGSAVVSMEPMRPKPAGGSDTSSDDDLPAKPAPVARVKKEGASRTEKGEFTPIVPVPAHAPPPKAKHPFRGAPERVWTYTRDGETLGYVYRFVTSDGGKETIPLVWAQSLADSTQKWVWKTWDQPRPLYLAGGRLRPGVVRIIVEGEKCADALHALIGEEFDVVSWPGGSKVPDRASWDWLLPAGGDEAPGKVLIWPDCDSQRRKLTPEEKAAGVDKDTVDFLPAKKQPGALAAAKIAQILDALGLKVWVCPVEEPGKLVSGWDCADAIAEGWDAERCKTYLRSGKAFTAVAPMVDDEVGQGSAGASDESGDPPKRSAWRIGLIRNEDGAPRAVRENVVLALQSLADVRGKIAFNEFSNDIIKLADMPWGSPAGRWTEVDELLMGEWLVRKHSLPSMPRTTLEEGMRMVATRNQYHPVREYLAATVWDGTPRLDDWLINAVVGRPEKLGTRERKYLQRVGAWFLMGMTARAMRPGCKFDYMPIFEGPQGMRKSTVLRVLAGDWFADTGFVLGDKDSLQMLQGRWLYEISELDAMARAEVTKIKAFIASQLDWYRASFDKRPREYPRQLVFAGTTNEHQYLIDGTGNRRFWPIDVTRVIDTDWVAANRNQLFAEAWARVAQGERYFPNTREELELFLPQQNARMIESPIESRLMDYLVNNAEGMLKNQIQIVQALAGIQIDITKLGPGRFHEKQAGTAFKKFGWVRARSSLPNRPWVYTKPDNWPDCMKLDDLDDPPSAPGAKAAPAPAADVPDTIPALERGIFSAGDDEPF